MNKNRVIIGSFLIIGLGIAGYFYLTQEISKSPSLIKNQNDQSSSISSNANSQRSKNTLEKKEDQKDHSHQKKREQSLNKIVSTFSKIKMKEMKSDNFQTLIKKLDLNPEVTLGKSGQGRMTILRTTNNLPGTRYIHAQFFGKEKKEFMQHLSFEYQKGENAFEEVVDSVRKSYPIQKGTESRNGKFVKWDLDQDYQIWVKELNSEDMRYDPFNAYDLETDPGAIRVTVELKIH